MIELSGISCAFGSLTALRDVNLHVQRGEFVSLVGASGSGKTTLLRVVAGLQSPTHGTVRVDGGPPSSARRAKRVALVPQSPALLPWRTVRENVGLLLELGKTSKKDRADDRSHLLDQLLADVGLSGFGDAYPHQLSGGMQQRVALVRAFALDAPLLLLDEPFGALDEITRADMRHLLARLCERSQATVLFVTHSLSEAIYLSDRVGVLSDRPGTVRGLHDVDLARPRTPDLEDDPIFFEYLTALRHDLQAARSAAPLATASEQDGA